MKFFVSFFTLVFFLAAAGAAGAEEKKEKKSWSNETELSYVETGGNTEVSNLSAKNRLTWQVARKLKLEWSAAALTGKTDGDRTAERYTSEVRAQYAQTERFFTAFYGGWLRDKFAGIDHRYYCGPALGYVFLETPKHHLSMEGGLDYVSESYIDHTDSEYVRGRWFGKYTYTFTEKTRFSQSLEYLHDCEDSDNYAVNSETAVTTALSDVISLKTSYTINYDNEPVPKDLETTDRTLAMAILVNF